MPAYQENNGSRPCSQRNNEGASSRASKERSQRCVEQSPDGFLLSTFPLLPSVTQDTSYFMNERRRERNQSFVKNPSDTFLLASCPLTSNITPETYYYMNERRENKESNSSPTKKKKKFTKFESYDFRTPTSSNDIESWFWKI
eukprot:46403_1